MGKKGKEAKRREKKQRTGRKHSSLKPHEYYEISGDTVTRKRKGCPRCGPGTILSEHKGRLYCGKCGYTEFERKTPSPESVHEEKPGQPKEGQPSKEDRPSAEDTQKGAGRPSAEDRPSVEDTHTGTGRPSAEKPQEDRPSAEKPQEDKPSQEDKQPEPPKTG